MLWLWGISFMFDNKVTSDISSKLTQLITKLQIATMNLQNNKVSNFYKDQTLATFSQ